MKTSQKISRIFPLQQLLARFSRSSIFCLGLAATSLFGCQKGSDDFTQQELKTRLQKVDHNILMCPSLPVGTFYLSDHSENLSTIVVTSGTLNDTYRITLNVEGLWIQVTSNGEVHCEQSKKDPVSVCVQASCVAPGKITVSAAADNGGVFSKTKMSLWSADPALSVQFEGNDSAVRTYQKRL